jgi:RNA-directed DNA polymerase
MISQGTEMNVGEPKYPSKKEKYATTSRKKQGVANGTLAVGPPHSTREVPETGWREGGGSNAMSSGETPAIHRDGAREQTKLGLITERAKRDPKCRFTSLAHLLSEGYLLECFRELKRNKAPGIDGVTVEAYEENLSANIRDVVKRLKGKRYRPQPARRVYIPKGETSKRPLGLLIVEDKIVQMGVKKILEAIWEEDFVDVSYGFRPNRSCHDALEAVDKTIMTKPVGYVVDMDIEQFFDSVDHRWMMECLRQRISDPNLLRLIARFLKAGVMEEGKYLEVDKGTPQGGIISPVLANIYLHYVLDLWFQKRVRRAAKGYLQLTRYADDFIVCCEHREDAEAFGAKLKERLTKFGLRISEAKSRTIEFGRAAWQKVKAQRGRPETFTFLGFTHYCATTRRGTFRVGRKTSRKKLTQKLKALNQWLKSVRNRARLKEWWQVLRQKLIGHYRYYGISGNIRGIEVYYREAVRLAHKWINRRSQRKSYNWERYRKFLIWNPVPMPRIYHRTYTLYGK